MSQAVAEVGSIRGGMSDAEFEAHLKQLEAEEAQLDQRLREQAGEVPAASGDAAGSGSASDVAAGGDAPDADAGTGEGSDGQGPEGSKPESGKPDEEKPNEGKAEGEKEGEGKPDEAEGKAKSRYEKELERRERSWEKLNQEKEQLRKEREELERARQELEAQRKVSGDEGLTPEDYEAAAKRFRADGKLDLADEALRKAKELRERPREEVVEREQRLSFERAKAKYGPDLVTPGTPLNTEVLGLLKRFPALSELPNFPEYAAEWAAERIESGKVMSEASRVPELEQKVQSLTKELEALRSATAISPAGAAKVPQVKAFEEMSLEEQEAELRRLTAAMR